jgi:hypothetical protein
VERPKFVNHVPLIESSENLLPRAGHRHGRVVDVVCGHGVVCVGGCLQVSYN